jgi:carboxypeptidase PM20D1
MKKLVQLAGGGLLLGVVVIGGIVTFRTRTSPPAAVVAAGGSYTALKLDESAVVQRFVGAVKLHTVSTGDAPPSMEDLNAFHAYLAQQFPQVYQHLLTEQVGHGALLFTWKGSDGSAAPIILMAHQDTVPIDPETRSRWTRDPWSGEVADGVIWGRGALDDKASLVGTLEAAEQLLQQGFQPKRTIYFAFGSDEERGGEEGAQAIVALLKQRGIHAHLVLDEGGAFTRDLLPGVSGDLAMVGIAEKGYLTVKLTVQAAGGHSSQPPPQSAIGILSVALTKLEAHQMPSRLTPTATAMFDAVGPLLPYSARMAVRNRWLFGPALINKLAATPSGNSMIRTTTAVTTFNAGVKDNVLPTVATATVNFRILPGDSVADVLQHVRSVVDDSRVEIEPGSVQNEPSPTSPIDGEGFKLVQHTIQQLSPGVPVVPYLVTAGTDAAHYVPVSTEQLRFVPYHLTPTTFKRFHGINEGIPVSDYLNCVQFAAQFMRNAAG